MPPEMVHWHLIIHLLIKTAFPESNSLPQFCFLKMSYISEFFQYFVSFHLETGFGLVGSFAFLFPIFNPCRLLMG